MILQDYKEEDKKYNYLSTSPSELYNISFSGFLNEEHLHKFRSGTVDLMLCTTSKTCVLSS